MVITVLFGRQVIASPVLLIARWSTQTWSGQEAAILSYIDPLVAVVIGVLVLQEPLSWQQLFGGALILGFTLLNELDIDS